MDSWKWRQIDLTPIGLGQTFEEPQQKQTKGGEPPAVREQVTYIILHFLATGSAGDHAAALPERATDGPFSDDGLDIANVSDRWSSPGDALCSIVTPGVKKK